MAKVILFGQAQFGTRVLEGLVAAGHEVVAACVPPGRQGQAIDPLQAAASARGVRLVQRQSYKSEDADRELQPERADLGVLAYVTQIIPARILDAPRLGSICFHPSLLPAYRGGSAINWQLINGETVGGVTLFRPDDGIDTGPIYLQREIAIGPDDAAGSYYYGKVFELGVEATLDTVAALVAGRATARPQDERLASYQPLCRDEHARIDWARPAAELHNLIRGCDPSPGAHARFGAETVRLYGSRRADAAAAEPPGTVLRIDADAVEISAKAGRLRIAKLGARGAKRAAAEVAGELGMRVGSRLA
jgi:methionyl-tRNA formyltransferase